MTDESIIPTLLGFLAFAALVWVLSKVDLPWLIRWAQWRLDRPQVGDYAEEAQHDLFPGQSFRHALREWGTRRPVRQVHGRFDRF